MEIGKTLNIQREYQKIEKTTDKLIETKSEETKSEETKVERIKREIDEGTYKVDLNKTAELIAKSLI